jgi:hypothetical protein
MWHAREGVHTKFQSENKGIGCLGDLDLERRIMLKWIDLDETEYEDVDWIHLT